MKKLIYIIILAAFYSCNLFSQPDTLEYYSKEFGDSVLAENAKLTDSLIRLNYIHDLVIDRLDSLTISKDTAYWANYTALMETKTKQENQLFESRVKLPNNKEVVFLYVAGKVNTRIMSGDTVATQYNIDLRQLK